MDQAAFTKEAWKTASKYDYKNFQDKRLKRRFEFLSMKNFLNDPKDSEKFIRITTNMKNMYGTAKICPPTKRNCSLDTDGISLDPGITKIISKPFKKLNITFEDLKFVWKSWRDATGKLMRTDYQEYIKLTNKAAKDNQLNDGSDKWLKPYIMDQPDFRERMEVLWKEVEPLYKKLHAYVRHKLSKYWVKEKLSLDNPIPAHILGNMWGQSWSKILPLVAPFPTQKKNFIQTAEEELMKQNYTVEWLYEMANCFYIHLGLADMTMSFNTTCGLENTTANKECFKGTPLIKRPDWDVICHASAWLMDDSKDDYRIKMCTKLNLRDFYVIQHEMGHIQYYIQHKNQPEEFKEGGNPGFHEAIGDVLALPVVTPKYLQGIGLLNEYSDSFEDDINFLMVMALDKVALLPWTYLVDQYRWSLFNGTIRPENMNYRWWELRERYQGLAPPMKRSEADFDAGGKYHVPADVPYLRYFVSQILQFQFYLQLCQDSGQYDPNDTSSFLHKCDFSKGEKSKEAAKKLIKLLKTGSSKPWPDILYEFTCKKNIDAVGLKTYFGPLEKWLDQYIKAHNLQLGWNSTVRSFFDTPPSS